jgi:hypothetical protein
MSIRTRTYERAYTRKSKRLVKALVPIQRRRDNEIEHILALIERVKENTHEDAYERSNRT